MWIGVLERPAARPHVGTLDRPVALDVEHLERREPVERRPHGLSPGFASSLKQRMSGERRVPHRRQAGLAIGLVLADDEKLLDRLARHREMRMIRRVAERVIHQHTVRHGGIDRAKTILAIEALGHESFRRGDGAAAQGDRKERLGALQEPVDPAKELHGSPSLVGAGRPLAHCLRRSREQLPDRNAAPIDGAGFQRLQDQERDHDRARPIGHLVEMKRKPARQKHDLDRHGRDAAPGNLAVERKQEAGEDIALRRPAIGEDRFARTGHVRRLDVVADHFQREIGFHAGAHVEGPIVNERPAAMVPLDPPQIDGDQPLELKIGLFAAKVPQEHIFGRDRRVGLELEAPMAVLVLAGEQRLRRARDVPFQSLQRRRDLRWIEGDVHV